MENFDLRDTVKDLQFAGVFIFQKTANKTLLPQPAALTARPMAAEVFPFRPRSKCGSIPVPSQISSLQKSYLFYHDAHSLARRAAISSPTHLLCVPCGSFPSAARPRESLVYRNAVSVNKKVLRCSYRRTLKSLSYINNVRKSYLTVPVRS